MAISVDRIHGVAGGLAIKAPVRVATTANITLSGLQTIDGIALADQDRVLVKNQTTGADNGIWVATTSSWSRALDFNGALDVVQGTLASVVEGTVNAGSVWRLTTASPVITSTSLAFSLFSTLGAAGSARVVGSIAILKTLDKNQNTQAFVTGYYAQGDGGGGAYWYDSSDTTSVDNGGTIIVATDGGRWKLSTQSSYTIRQFGAHPGQSGATNKAAIQAAIDALTGWLIVPAGTYPVSGGIAWTKNNLWLIGEGEGASTLSFSHATDDLIRIGDGAANPNNSGIAHLSITSSVAKTAGAAIRLRNGHNLKISHVRLDSNLFWGIQLDGGAQQFLYYVDHFEINSGTEGIIVGEDGTLVQDFWLDTGIVSGATSDGILLKHVSGFYFRDIDLLGCGSGITTFPGVGKQVVAGWCDTVIADTCNSHGWKMITNGGLVAELTLTACWGASCGVTDNGHGMYFAQGSGNIKGVSLTAPRCINNKGDGLLLEAGEDITIANPQMLANSTQGSGVKHGIEIAAGVSQWSISGGVCGGGGLFPTNNQGYGIIVNAGASDNYAIEGVNVLGNVTGGISDGGTGTTKHISHNMGYRTTNRGAGNVANGTSSVNITHGLAATPVQTDILISPTVDIAAAGVARIWVSAAGATTFTVTTNVATTADLFFAWDARIKGA